MSYNKNFNKQKPYSGTHLAQESPPKIWAYLGK